MRDRLIELLSHKQQYGIATEEPPEAIYTIENHQVADHLLANGVTMQEWISVKDRLPDPFVDVLVSRNGKISIDYYEEDGSFAYDFKGRRVTHWMPLPQPPIVDKQN